tara:strand:- start:1532 stop:2197 length:666 start_codon:yes stop_codon:yes gene_type:complete
MSVEVTTTGGTIVSTSTSLGTSVSLTSSSTSVSVSSPAVNSIAIASKGPKGDTGATGAAGATGATGVAGTSFSYISCGYYDDISTILHYLPLNGPPNEYTSDGNSYTDWVAPCAVTVLSAQIRFSSLSGFDGNLTMTVWKDPIGSETKASVEAETVAVTTTDDNDVVHFLFDGASIAKGEAMKISIQADADVTGSSNTFVTIVLLMDWADRYTVSSAVIAS